MNTSPFPDIKGYTPVCLCGEGAYGQVWLVQNVTGRRFALKIIYKKALGGDWKREYNGLVIYHQKVERHPNLIEIYHIEDRETFFYYTMECADNMGKGKEYIPGTLENMVKEFGRINPDRIVNIFSQLLDGVETLHGAGVIHRDIKPDNIIFVNGVPKLSDIGLVTSLSKSISLVGTQPYLPPEVITGKNRLKDYSQVDLYALGKSIYRALSGNHPDEFPKLPMDILKDKKCRKLNNLVKNLCHTSPICRIQDIKAFRVILTDDSELAYIFKTKARCWVVYPFHNLIYSNLMNTTIVALLLLLLLLVSFLVWNNSGNSVNTIIKDSKDSNTTVEQELKGENNAGNKLVPLAKKNEYYTADMLSDLIVEKNLPTCLPDMNAHPHDGELSGTPRMSKVVFDSNNKNMAQYCVTKSPSILFGNNMIKFKTEGGTVYIKKKLPRQYDLSFKIDFDDFFGMLHVAILANFEVPGIEMSKPVDKSLYSYSFDLFHQKSHFTFFQAKYQRGGTNEKLRIGCNSQVFKGNASYRNIRIVMTDKKLRIYIDGELISSCPALFKGGILAISTKAKTGIVSLEDIVYRDIRSIPAGDTHNYEHYKLPLRVKKTKTVFVAGIDK
jgi:serine/threonine protein kinase